MSGILPASSVFKTRSALFTHVAVISLRYLELAAPSFFCSGMATAMLPASSTMWPMPSRRASRPATRTAEGPMSTPRRDWPRSSGTPITRIWRGVMLLNVVFRRGIRFLFTAETQSAPRKPFLLVGLGRLFFVPLVVWEFVHYSFQPAL